jgi:DNA primase
MAKLEGPIMKLSPARSDTLLQPRVLAHYGLVGPLMEASLGNSPIVYSNYPDGVDQPGVYHVTEVPLTHTKLLWPIHSQYAMSFFTWAPSLEDQDRLRFARVLIEGAGAPFDRVKRAAFVVRDVLRAKAGWQSIPLIDGGNGIALWIPLADEPHAAPLRARLHELCGEAIAQNPDLISGEANTHGDGRVHVHVSSNAARRYSAAPYSLRPPNLTVCAPVRWEELDSITSAGTFTDEEFPDRLAAVGDLFSTMVAEISSQHLTFGPPPAMANTPAPRGHIILAAIQILEDGVARTADQLLQEAIRLNLLTTETKRKYVYTALTEYIARQVAHGRRTPILQDEQRRFVINEPPDDWPDIEPVPRDEAQVRALCERLETTSMGDDPEAFEFAVCDAFAHLGFLTQHVGGHGAPDGIANAILGALAYRVTIECKTSKHPVNQSQAPEEAAKFRDGCKAQFSVLVGPEISSELELLDELRKHRVTAVSVADLQTLLQIDATAREVRTLLVPGYCSDELEGVLWERRHGAAKRVSTIANLIVREGWKQQQSLAKLDHPKNIPQFTVEHMFEVVDNAIVAAGSAQGCIRADVVRAFELITGPTDGRAVWTDNDCSSIVIVRPG